MATLLVLIVDDVRLVNCELSQN